MVVLNISSAQGRSVDQVWVAFTTTSWITMTSWCSPDGPDKMTRWRMAGSFHAKMFACSWGCMNVFGMFVQMCVCMHACMYVRMTACMSVYMPVCLNVCMLVYLCVSICLSSISTGWMVTPSWRAGKLAFSPDHWATGNPSWDLRRCTCSTRTD